MINRGDIKLAIDMVVNAQDDNLFGGEAEYVINTLEDCGNTIAAQAAVIDELQQNNSEYLLLIEAEKSEWRTAHDAALIYKYKSEKTHAALKLVLDVVVPYTENGCASIPDYISNLSREALAIPTDSTQILAEVRRAERERVAQYVQQGTGDWMLGKKIAEAIRAME